MIESGMNPARRIRERMNKEKAFTPPIGWAGFTPLEISRIQKVQKFREEFLRKESLGLTGFTLIELLVVLKELWKLKWHRGYRINDPSPVWPDWMRSFRDY